MPKRSAFTFNARFIIPLLVNLALLLLVNNLEKVPLPLITDNISKSAWALILLFGITAFSNFAFLFYAETWFRHLIEGFLNIAECLVFASLHLFFPFSFEGGLLYSGLRWLLLIIAVLLPFLALSEFIGAVKGLINLYRG